MAFSFTALRAFFTPAVKNSRRQTASRPKKPAASESKSVSESASADAAGVDAEPGTSSRRRIGHTYAREAAALLLIACGLYAGLALASYAGDPLRPEVHGADWVGPVGGSFAAALVGLIGVVAWLLPVELVLLARPLLSGRRIKLHITRLSGDVVITVIAAALTHIALPDLRAFGHMPLGGEVGNLFGEIGRGLFSTVGSFLIGMTIIALILVERSTFSFIDLIQQIQTMLAAGSAGLKKGFQRVSSAWSTARSVEQKRLVQERLAAEPRITSASEAESIIAAFADCDGKPGAVLLPRSEHVSVAPAPAPSSAPESPAILHVPDEVETPALNTKVALAAVSGEPEPSLPLAHQEELTPTPILPVKEKDSALPTKAKTSGAAKVEKKAAVGGDRQGRRRAKKKESEPRIVDTAKLSTTAKSRRRRGRKFDETNFELPATELLDPMIGGASKVDEAALRKTARLLEKTLLDYRVEGTVQEIHPGPTVTMFEVSPAPGTKVSKVAGLADDLALGLSRTVRIIAPIPGKNRIGFEVPNDVRVSVNMRELIETHDFMEMKAPLPCVLGRDIIGRPFFADLASMPHVIVAGATGAGKSVGLNVMLMSLLYRRTPADVRLLMIDPKVVELAPFDKIPHLLFPVVTDMKQAANALKWAVDEMERRYQLFADAGTRNVVTYNRWVKRVLAGELPMPAGPKTVPAIGPEGEQLELPAAKEGAVVDPPKKLPYVVIVVEEFADLMMQQGKDVEASVARLAQKARAAGMHVILATQRPSVDVITGIIKANFPTRIAYRVAQKVDSRTILDQQGAEHLLGKGDMLVKLNGTNEVQRVQCPFVSEDEVQRVTDMLREQGEPEYDENIVKSREEETEGKSANDAQSDPLYDQAVRIVAETGKCSTSWIQRKLGIGYNRAAKIVETMERNEIVGPPNGSKPREILISSH